jgi:hypothetical protein
MFFRINKIHIFLLLFIEGGPENSQIFADYFQFF